MPNRIETASSGAGFRLSVADDHETLSRAAADLVISELERRPQLLLCASAGGTPRRAYELIAERCARRPRLASQLRVLQIDEWAGLPRGHPATCEADLRRNLIDPLGLRGNQFVCFQSNAPKPEAECRRIARWLIQQGPVDFCILGLGTNGHVAMNEPGETLASGVHLATLAASSLRHPLLAGLARKPRRGFTLGMGDILRSKQILLLVSGCAKARALSRLLTGRVDTRFPASFLWLHGNAAVLCDQEALSSARLSPKSLLTRAIG